MMSRLRAWFDRWGAILPLLVAEFVVWLGFGGLLPVLPIYFADQGVDLGTLGLVIAAWPAARLVSEPIFGWLADRTARVPLMVIGLVATGIFGALPLVWTGPLAFFLLRAGAGLGAAVYDPAARGFLTEATPPDRRGEAFGLYGAAQMGGLLLGPSIGAFGAEHFGGIAFVFVFSAIAAIVAGAAIALRVREEGPARKASAAPWSDRMTLPPDSPYVEGRAAAALAADARASAAGDASEASSGVSSGRTMRLLNRGLVAAIILNAGGFYGGGTYEVIWSLFLKGLGADLALIGLTFAMFGLPVLVLSPFAGRLVDRRGSLAFIVLGMVLPAITGILYTLMRDPGFAVPLILIEATGFAFLNPALYAVVAASSPPGRSSTAQGIFGAAGTLGFIVASVTTGFLAERSILLPFYSFSVVMVVTLVAALFVGGSRLHGRASETPAHVPATAS
ncbi:MAG TPA: MFS transporter [Candidatus Limnocylindrales bacterium]|nr:MFS transporter [Candidatus Limnocylindrales bacterium]